MVAQNKTKTPIYSSWGEEGVGLAVVARKDKRSDVSWVRVGQENKDGVESPEWRHLPSIVWFSLCRRLGVCNVVGVVVALAGGNALEAGLGFSAKNL
jgi:hypothetical protein